MTKKKLSYYNRLFGIILVLVFVINTVKIPVSAAPNVSFLSGKWKYESVNTSSGRVRKKLSYTYSNGKLPRDITRINGKVYLFGSDGKLSRSKVSNRIIKFRGKIYLIGSDGIAKSGWRIYNNKLYYFSKKTYAALTNRNFGGIVLGTDGTAKNTLNANLKKECLKILSSCTKESDSKATKLRKAFDYMASRRNFSYALKYPDMKTKSWGKTHAYNMLTTRSGNCYSFACAFAALASEIGYTSYVVPGRIHGNRDHAADGYTRHCVAKVGSLYYDPELKWATGNGCFAAPYCPVQFVVGEFKFKSFEGNKYTNNKAAKVEKNKLILKNGYYQYYNSKGGAVYGTYCIKHKLYKFKKNEGISVADFNKLQTYVKEGAEYDQLVDQIGKSISTSSAASCYEPGATDYIHKYKHLVVYTVKGSDNVERVTYISSK